MVAQGKLVGHARHSWLVATAVALAAFASGTGCFFASQIDERPSVAITGQPSTQVYRGDTVMLTAETSSPTNRTVDVQWSVYLCTNPSDTNTDCDQNPIDSDTTPLTMFVVQPMRADKPLPTLGVRVLLDAVDDLGAVAEPTQELIIAVDDHPPTLTLTPYSSHDDAVGSHITLDIQVSDPDDPPAGDTLSLMVEPPGPNAPYTLTTPVLLGSAVGDSVTWQAELDAQVIGIWTVAVTATDPEQKTGMESFVLPVGSDMPPCITEPSPIADPSNVYPLLAPTLFEVPIVVDDLDVYPPSSTPDPDSGVATFHWSILEPGGSAFAPLAVTGNGVPLDPSTYSPGDVIQLRVEVHDRVTRDFTGCGNAPTCALNASSPSCLQRTTWQVEVP
jgi:hypothetical protein